MQFSGSGPQKADRAPRFVQAIAQLSVPGGEAYYIPFGGVASGRERSDGRYLDAGGRPAVSFDAMAGGAAIPLSDGRRLTRLEDADFSLRS